jgi:hypothetical protein
LPNPWSPLFGPNGGHFESSAALSNPGLKATPGTSQVLRYNGGSGAFKSVFVAPGSSGGLKLPSFLMSTKTDPTTLNYNP